jgi:hypothetical protein
MYGFAGNARGRSRALLVKGDCLPCGTATLRDAVPYLFASA